MCYVRIKIHLDKRTGRWFVEFFSDQHNHDMLDARFWGLLHSHRAIKEGELHQINCMRKVGMQVSTIFRAFANQSDGFDTVGFEMKDIYNAIENQRRAGATNMECDLKYLCSLKSNDASIFWKYSLDDERRLQNIFWCGRTSHYDLM
ncbi:hypothetical protein S83_050917 [Arachis hypogaea]